MLKPYFILSFLMIICVNANAQSFKAYITEKGDQTADSLKAKSYILCEMNGDSAWLMRQYNMHDTIMAEGTFKDSLLTIPHGKFTFYRLVHSHKVRAYNANSEKIEFTDIKGGNFIAESGVYLNGKKNGPWRKYNNGKLEYLNTFENDKLNGLYQSYDIENGNILIKGNMVDDVRQGEWNSLSFYGDTMRTELYKNGKIIKTVSYLNDKKFKYLMDVKGVRYDILRYLNSKLYKNKFNGTGKYYASYSFTLTSEGKLILPVVDKSADSEIDKAILSALLLAPSWHPVIRYEITKTFLLTQSPSIDTNAVFNGEKKAYIHFDLFINVNANAKIDVSYPEKTVYIYD